MKDYSKEASLFFNNEIDPETENFVSLNVDIGSQVMEYLKELNWSQKDFAKELGKSDAEVSKWLSGVQNLTLRSIAKMQVALQKEIITTPLKAKSKYKQIEYVKLNVYATTNKQIVEAEFSDDIRSGNLFKKAI